MLRATFAVAAAGLLVPAACYCPRSYDPVEPAVIDTRPPGVYMLLNPVPADPFLMGKPVSDLGDGNIAINRWGPGLGEWRTPLRPWDGFPSVSGVVDHWAVSTNERGEPHAYDVVWDSSTISEPPIRYRIGGVRVGELPLSAAEIEGPHVKALLIGTICQNRAVKKDFCPASNEEVFAVMVAWPDTSGAEDPPPGSTAPPPW